MGHSPVLDARSRLATTVRLHRNDTKRVTDARRDLAAAKLAEYVRKTVAEAPPLTDEQRERIAALLRPSIGGPDAAA